MKERDFIEQNSEKWREFETLFSSTRKDPRRLTALFIQITEDLAYARTFYGNRSVRVYLNQVSQRVFQSVYKGRKFQLRGMADFWSRDLPDILWHSRVDLLVSFAVFALAIAIGILSGSQDSTFAQLILGEEYVSMTEANIEKGDPMYVYKDSNQLQMFWMIWTNNLRVAVLTFVMGAAYAIGTLFVLLFNGIMVGSFQYFFIERGLFQESFLTIFQHGTLELSAIVIAGAAGLTMGRGLVFPGTYTRLQSIRLSAVRGAKIMVPVFFMLTVAALIESWVTRLTGMPDIIRAVVIIVSLAIVLGYFVYYPRMRYRAGLVRPQHQDRIPAASARPVYLDVSKGVGQLFSETFGIYRASFPVLIRPILLMSLLMAGIITFWEGTWVTPFILDSGVPPDRPWPWIRWIISNLMKPAEFSRYASAPAMYFLNVGLWWLLMSTLLIEFGQHGATTRIRSAGESMWQRYRPYIPALLPVALLHSCLFIPSAIWGRMLFIALLPLMMLWAMSSVWGKRNTLSSLANGWELLRLSFLPTVAVFFALAILSLQVIWVINSPMMALFKQFVQMNIPLDGIGLYLSEVAILSFLAFSLFYLMLPLTLISMALSYWNARELRDAAGLRERLEQFGKRKVRWI